MSYIEAILLGIVQGLTEFLPISSSAHISIVGQLFGLDDPGAAFTAITQLGTEFAVLLYFKNDIIRIITKWINALRGKESQRDPDVRMGWMVIVGSIPIVVLGLLLEDFIDDAFRNVWVTATMLIVVGLMMYVADDKGKQQQNLTDLTWSNAISFGFAQSAALIPGVSRSGATITAGLAMGYTREAAARYSFLLAIPAVVGSGLYKLKDIGDDSAVEWGPVIAATLIAGAVGYAVIAWLLRYISTHSFKPFVYYRIMLAIAVVGMLVGGILEA